tara:strand:+ start:1015 stop:1380 length:366 start_codon:yes stop_codon:yes gene_type:complete
MKTLIAPKAIDEYHLVMPEWITFGIKSIPKEERRIVIKGDLVFIPAPSAESVWNGHAMKAKMVYYEDDYWIESEWLSEWYSEEMGDKELSASVKNYATVALMMSQAAKSHSLLVYKRKKNL